MEFKANLTIDYLSYSSNNFLDKLFYILYIFPCLVVIYKEVHWIHKESFPRDERKNVSFKLFNKK